MAGQALSDHLLREGVHAHAEVVEIAPRSSGRRTVLPSQSAIGRDQIDQGTPRAELNQAELIPATSLHHASEDVAIEPHHALEIAHAQDDVIDAKNAHQPISSQPDASHSRGVDNN
jgi:hypothetical protein